MSYAASIPPAIASGGHVVAATRVLVVDDSPTMRALISSVLERIPNVDVVGTAEDAAEARELIPRLHPDVLTLDIEMPGTSGIEYLSEIMTLRPMPVIMFSSLTGEGSHESIEAMRLGAIDCICKPRVASPSDFDAIVVRLGKRIAAASARSLRPALATQPPINWNGRLLAIGGDRSSAAMLFNALSAFPLNCPPTVVVRHLGVGMIEGEVARLSRRIAPRVMFAVDGMAIKQGAIYLAPAGDRHLVVDAWPEGKLRLLAGDPVAGERPSISILFASVARTAAAGSIGVLLTRGGGDQPGDGVAGLKALHDAGAYTVVADAAGGYTLAHNSASQSVTGADLPTGILRLCSK